MGTTCAWYLGYRPQDSKEESICSVFVPVREVSDGVYASVVGMDSRIPCSGGKPKTARINETKNR
jgi:hypothetical protein